MANCCICGDPAGRFEKLKPIDEAHPELTACGHCSGKWAALANPGDAYEYGVASRYFEGRLSRMRPLVQGAVRERLSLAQRAQERADEEARREEDARNLVREGKLLMTTGDVLAGYDVVSYHGVHSSDCMMGTGLLSDVEAVVTGITGTENVANMGKVTVARERALERMAMKCVRAGGNAILGIRYDVYTAAGLENAFCVGVSGTSVTVVKRS